MPKAVANSSCVKPMNLRISASSISAIISVALAAVPGDPGHFVRTLSPAQAPATGVSFKINDSPTTWTDYFFGYADVAYDTVHGDNPAALGWTYSDATHLNMAFVPDGNHSYEIHFRNQQGTCLVWIKKVL